MHQSRVCRSAWLGLAAMWLPLLAGADANAHRQAVESAVAAARAAAIQGPAHVALGEQASLALPEHFMFVQRKEEATLMHTMGNQTDDQFIGLVFPAAGGHWFVTVDYTPSGYIKDDDA